MVSNDDDDDKILGYIPNKPMYLAGAAFVACSIGGFLWSLCSCLFKCCCKKKEDSGEKKKGKKGKKNEDVEMVMIKVPKGASSGDKVRAPGTNGRTVTIPRGAKAGAFIKLPLNK
jgi:hypothetical protein